MSSKSQGFAIYSYTSLDGKQSGKEQKKYV